MAFVPRRRSNADLSFFSTRKVRRAPSNEWVIHNFRSYLAPSSTWALRESPAEVRTDLAIYDQSDLKAISHQINHMPRHPLSWQSSADFYARLALHGVLELAQSP